MNSRYAHVAFCDDVRREIGGLVTLVGCYGDTIDIAGNFPAIRPKFFIVVTVASPRSEPLNSVEFTITAPTGRDSPLLQRVFDNLGMPEDFDPEGDDEHKMINYVFELAFSPLRIAGPGHIEVRVTADDSLLRIARLPPRQGPALDLAASFGS